MEEKYSDIIKLRTGRAAYNIEYEKEGEWLSFIPNEQFNNVLKTVIKSVRGNDIDNHKSFWINGTYGTGKSHAVSVIKHLLSDPIDKIKEWIDYEYKDEKFKNIRQSIYTLRESKRLLPINIYGLKAMTHPSDLALVLQHAVSERTKGLLSSPIKTDYETLINHIKDHPDFWDNLINNDTSLSSIVPDREKLINNLQKFDLDTFHRTNDTLRRMRLEVRLESNNISNWLIEVQNALRVDSEYQGLLIIWDEFTDVMNEAIGILVLKQLQEIAETFTNEENDSYLFLISHPSAFDNIESDELKQTDGRYHRMKYNMESVSAFKIMSRKFEIVNEERHKELREAFYTKNANLLEIFTSNSNDANETKADLFNLYPLHPGTANLSAHYATVVGSSSRSVFEFLGQNDAVKEFLDDETCFLNRDTITADFLWDYVYKVFIDDIANYGAVTERFNSYKLQVENQGEAFTAIFKGILLLNAFNNISGENNLGLVTPSEENITRLFQGTKYESELEQALLWFNEQGIIQRAPGGLFSVQFTALPSAEIEDKKNELKSSLFRYTSQILKFTTESNSIFEKRFIQTVIRPISYEFYSDEGSESLLRNKIKNGKKNAKPSDLFLAILVSKNNAEVATLKSFAENASCDKDDSELQDIVFIVFEEPFTDKNYSRFIEYQANYACASSHGLIDQQEVHRNHSIEMIKDWLTAIQRANAVIYVNEYKEPISLKKLSSTLNSNITPKIFPNGPDSLELLTNKAPRTFWKQQVSKEIVRSLICAKSKSELSELNAVMRPIQFLFQDSVDENLNWNPDVTANHPLKAVCDFVEKKIKYADKTALFNLSEKFKDLTKSPYGLYCNYASMGMIAFAMRPFINKIFDNVGKPRDEQNLVDDIAELFNAWKDNKISTKLNFKFQTPEEGKLCKAFIDLFNLKSIEHTYHDISSLKDARYAITAIILENQGYPLWSLKYLSEEFLSSMPVQVSLNNELKKLIDNICVICSDREQKNPALITETLALINNYRFDFLNILKTTDSFKTGFNNYLIIEGNKKKVDLHSSEIEEAYNFIKANLQASIGYWTEDEVLNTLKDWRLSTYHQDENVGGDEEENNKPIIGPSTNSQKSQDQEKKNKAMNIIRSVSSLDDAKMLLERLCNLDYDVIFDEILK